MGASACANHCGLGSSQANTIDFTSTAGRVSNCENYKLHEVEACMPPWGPVCEVPAAGSRASDGLGDKLPPGDDWTTPRALPHGERSEDIWSEPQNSCLMKLPQAPRHCKDVLPLPCARAASSWVPALTQQPKACCNDPAFLKVAGNGDAAGGSGITSITGISSAPFPDKDSAEYGGPGNADNCWTAYFCREAEECQRLPAGSSCLGPRARRRYNFQTGATYDGEWLRNERSGLGTQRWPDGAEYTGEWCGNTATGGGVFRHSDGDMYTGQWRFNMAHGYGVYHHRDGTCYEGQFINDLQDGYGVETWPDRSQFRGRFIKGRKSGHGIYLWPDGSRYTGSWLANRIEGLGSYVGADGRRFDGGWRSSAMHGCGRYSWPDGRTYKGQYMSDQKEGFGIFSWTDGKRYEGYWVADKQHGFGLIYLEGSASGRAASWANGTRVEWLDAPEGCARPRGEPKAPSLPVNRVGDM